MGDMADFALEQVMDAEDDRFEYRMGRMSDALAYDLGIIDECGGYSHPPMFSTPRAAAHNKKCRYCGKVGLQWKNVESGWRLAERDGTVHCCEQYFRFEEVLHERLSD